MNLLKEKLNRLFLQLKYYNYLYYTLDSPVISDLKYDNLLNDFLELKKICKISNTQEYFLKKLYKNNGISFFSNVLHITPMLSLKSTSVFSDLFSYDNKLKKILNIKKNIEYFCDLKFDGLAINLIYKNGKLIHALTRGDGLKGENVTVNAMMIPSIPIKLIGFKFPKKMEIRGEVLMKHKDFIELNKDLINKKKILFLILEMQLLDH